jgi:hypothetical protein
MGPSMYVFLSRFSDNGIQVFPLLERIVAQQWDHISLRMVYDATMTYDPISARMTEEVAITSDQCNNDLRDVV